MIGEPARRVCVYKVGGSLFEWPELFGRLEAFLKAEGTRPLLVSGGGGAADAVRHWDRVHGLGEARSHRLAIKSLGLGEAFLADGLAGAAPVSDRPAAETAWAAGQNDLPALVPGAQQIIAAESAHYIPFQQPELVVAAIRDVVTALRITGSR